MIKRPDDRKIEIAIERLLGDREDLGPEPAACRDVATWLMALLEEAEAASATEQMRAACADLRSKLAPITSPRAVIWAPDMYPLPAVAEAAESVLAASGAPARDYHQAVYLLTTMRPR